MEDKKLKTEVFLLLYKSYKQDSFWSGIARVIYHVYNIILFLVPLNHPPSHPYISKNEHTAQQEPRLDNTFQTYISFLSALLAGNKDEEPNF